ncbi:MAG: hypothetical protein LBS91_06970 [Clostridiales Family XIII bacterium]|jgi:hypothetical protein|nr:hypothetical protein [Clostridiales Family XIII bacterium]
MFEIVCKELTPARKKELAGNEVSPIGKPFRLVLAVGGAYLFYYGTSGEAPSGFQSAATAFVVIGIAAVLLAIFSQKIIEGRYFAKATKAGCFPVGVTADDAGVAISHAGNVGTHRTFSFSEIGKVEEVGTYFRLGLLRGEAPGVFLYKEDFAQGEPEAFASFIASKKAAEAK